MTRAPAHIVLMTGFLWAWCVATASAEPKFLSKQYPRCTSCHYSPTGGGLLTAYGRSLSHRELSTFGEPLPSHDDTTTRDTTKPEPGEESFLFGAFGKSLDNLQLGIFTRPSYLHYSFPGFSDDRNLLMNADLHVAYRYNDWTFYGQLGRELDEDTGHFKLDSSEYWIGRQPEEGLGFRVGRFLPAYGIRFADHTSYNREFLELAQYDQILGAELSYSRGRYLTQVSLGPGRAQTIIEENGGAAFTTTGRFQIDLTPRTVVAASGTFRDGTDFEPRQGSTGLAFGYAPTSHVTTWTQFDAQFIDGQDATSYVFVNETSFEVYRGIWAVVSPQARFGGGEQLPDLLRLGLGAVLLPRTHFNVNVSYYRDRDRSNDITTNIFLAQFHLYL
jgi:hypothetical protein